VKAGSGCIRGNLACPTTPKECGNLPDFTLNTSVYWNYLGCKIDSITTGIGNSITGLTNGIIDGLNGVKEAISNISINIQTTITNTITDFTGNLWDKGVNGVDSGIRSLTGGSFGLKDVIGFAKLVVAVLLILLGLFIAFLLLLPFLQILVIILMQTIFIIMAFNNRENKTAWDKLKQYIEYNIRYVIFGIGLYFFLIIDLILKLSLGNRWKPIGGTMIRLGLTGF
jgi:uncharacterized membrane protein YphA (DoxX/SURF4 family)